MRCHSSRGGDSDGIPEDGSALSPAELRMSKRVPSVSFAREDDLDSPTLPSQWLPTVRPLRRFRTYVLLAIFILAVYYTFHRSPPSSNSQFFRYDSVDWSRYAYSQYATSSAYLCNAVMVFEALHRLGSRAERILFYPEEWDTEVESSTDRNSQLLVLARDHYNVQLVPIKVPTFKQGPGPSRPPMSVPLTQ